MKRLELVLWLAQTAEVSAKDAGAVLDALTSAIDYAIKHNGSFEFPEIGPIAPVSSHANMLSPFSSGILGSAQGSAAPRTMTDVVSSTTLGNSSGAWGGPISGSPNITSQANPLSHRPKSRNPKKGGDGGPLSL